MSITYSVYVGPFFRCKFHMVETTGAGWFCSNPKCRERNSKVAFSGECKNCGSKIAERSISVARPSVDDWIFHDDEMKELARECDEKPDFEHWFIPNYRHDDEPREFSFEPREFTGLFGANFDITAEKVWLARSFCTELFILKSKYDSVSVEWGVISHAS